MTEDMGASWDAFTDAWRGRECDPSYSLEKHIASLRDTDPEKWARLNREWEDRP